MSTFYDEVFKYISNWDIETKSLSENANLIDFIKGLQAEIDKLSTVPNSHPGIVNSEHHSTSEKIVTYCGEIGGTDIFRFLKKVYEKEKGYYIMSYTEMGELLNLSLKDGLYYAISELLKKDSNFSNRALKKEFIQYNILGGTHNDGNRSKYVKDINGSPIEGLLTIFDYCSAKIVGANASENALFIGNETSGTDNVFVLTELPTLLNSSRVMMIDGIETSFLLTNRSSESETDLVEIFNCLIKVCNEAFSGMAENIVLNNSNYQCRYMFIITQLNVFISKLLN